MPLVAQSKPAITLAEYGKWEDLETVKLSATGEWLAYTVKRVSDDGELRIRGISRDTTFIVPFGSNATFSADGRWLAYSVGVSPAERERLQKEKKPAHNATVVRNLETNDTVALDAIASFAFSPDGASIALRGYAADNGRVAELFVQDLRRPLNRLSLANVGEYAWSTNRSLLAFTVESRGETGNSVQVLDAATGVARTLERSDTPYLGLAWRSRANDLAVLRARPGFRDTTHVIVAWSDVGSPAMVVRRTDPTAAQRPARGMRVSESRRPRWSRDGRILYFGMRARDSVAASDSLARARHVSDVQVWHSADMRIIPVQRASESRDLQATILHAWHVNDGRIVRLGSNPFDSVTVLEGDRYATELDTKPYAWGTMFGRPYADVWLIDIATGARRRVVDKVRWFYGGSATGKTLAWFDGKNYWTQDVTETRRTNLTARLSVDFTNVDDDHPSDLRSPAGFAGWVRNDDALLVYDAHDVWRLSPDEPRGTRLTRGAEDHVVHRLVTSTRAGDTPGVDLARPLYLSLFDTRTKKSGYARLVRGRPEERLVFEDARLSRLVRADSGPIYAFSRERFDVSPQLLLAGADLTHARVVAETNVFQREYAWGRAELVRFTSRTGQALDAALYYPANFDPSRKYPMVVTTYERLSDLLHVYSVPYEARYAISSFTAQGYFVLTPDIVFRPREPGLSTIECVEPAVEAIVTRGLVDPARIGHVGASWGGYEAAYLATHSQMFAAVVVGAGVTDFISFAGQIHWTSGIPEFSHWETGQGRMQVAPWEDFQAHVRNSPLTRIHEMKTAVLLAAGDADGTVDWRQSVEFYNYARRAGKKNVVMLVYPGEGHGFLKKENRTDYEQRMLEWLGHYLKGEPAPHWMTSGIDWLERKAVLDAGR